MLEERNYIRDYFKRKDYDLKSLINKNSNTEDKIKEIKKQIADLQKSITIKSDELHKEIENMYSTNFEPTSKRIVIQYNGRHGSSTYFDLDSGLPIDDVGCDDIVYNIGTKKETIYVVVGYSYEYACIIINAYEVLIDRDNTKMKTKLIEEYIINFLDDEKESVVFNVAKQEMTMTKSVDYKVRNAMQYVKDNEFINKLFGANYEGDINLAGLRCCYRDNKSFEIIIKTSPKSIVDRLLRLNLDKALPIHKILGISQDTYNKAIERDMLLDVYDNKDYISGKYNENNKNGAIQKTESEWLEIIDEIKHYEEDLKFYNIEIGGYSYRCYNGRSLLSFLTDNYTHSEVFVKNYSFNKFINYVVNETINQGYTRVDDFVFELRDYLEMCEKGGIKPTLYSSYLKQTHDITSRNYNVKVEQEQEEIFKSKYKDFKTYQGKKYYVVAPKSSSDLKKEGNTLNHCVASYIKRVIDNECLIYFLRKDKEESLITFEVRHNTIVQVKGMSNRKPNESEIKALKEFAKYRNMETNF